MTLTYRNNTQNQTRRFNEEDGISGIQNNFENKLA